MHVDWIKCKGGAWCHLNTLNLNSSHFDDLGGVYLIWHGGPNPRAVYVGQGNIRKRLSAHRQNEVIQEYKNFGTLLVTWAEVPAHLCNGVEVFLANAYNPLVGEQFPDAAPITVNLP